LKKPDLDRVGWVMPDEKLLCLMALSDEIAAKVTNKAGEAFFRAFIVENRQTGIVKCKMRYRYADGDTWYTLQLKDEEQKNSRAEKVTKIQEGIEGTIRKALTVFSGGIEPPKEVFGCFYPPDDGGDYEKTLSWLISMDLVGEPKHEEIEE